MNDAIPEKLHFAGVIDASQGLSRRTRRRLGRFFICSAAGTIGQERIELGDLAISDGKAWMIVRVFAEEETNGR